MLANIESKVEFSSLRLLYSMYACSSIEVQWAEKNNGHYNIWWFVFILLEGRWTHTAWRAIEIYIIMIFGRGELLFGRTFLVCF